MVQRRVPRCSPSSTKRPRTSRATGSRCGHSRARPTTWWARSRYLNFNRIHDRFYELVLRADVGKIDVAWAKREDHRLRIDALTRERARELQALDDEFRDVMDQNQARARHERVATPSALLLVVVASVPLARHRSGVPDTAAEPRRAGAVGGRDGRHACPRSCGTPTSESSSSGRPRREQQLEALRQLEEEVDRFSESGEAFRSTVTSLVRREYLQQRRERDRWYGEQLEAEERAFNEARDTSIRVFEEFLRRYPNHAKYTPDAMFRLGELYFERSAVDFQNLYDDAQAAREAGDLTAEDNLPSSPDFTATVDLYKTLAASFPAYERSDGVYYLIGYTLNEMGRPEEAVAAWLALVCANKYRYDPDWRPPPAERLCAAAGQVPGADPRRAAAGRSVGGTFVNPYKAANRSRRKPASSARPGSGSASTTSTTSAPRTRSTSRSPRTAASSKTPTTATTISRSTRSPGRTTARADTQRRSSTSASSSSGRTTRE